MRCSNCGSENPVGKKFCGNCGTQLGNSCPKCGVENPQSNKFCGDCGAVLAADSRTTASSNQLPSSAPAMSEISIAAGPASGAIPDGERKTVTALFADIKGSMELMEDLDPEEARAIVDPALKLMIDAVHRYDGYIVQSTGDGIFALFGAPVAHEDHPQRALYAALRMQEEMRRYSDQLRAAGNLPIRGAGRRQHRRSGGPFDQHRRRARRVHADRPFDQPGGADADAGADRLGRDRPRQRASCARDTSAFKSLGPTRIKGVSEPVNVFEVIGLGPLRTRLQVAAQRGLTKFVGRQAELEQMKHALELARAGHGQIVAAMGEPGVGKSRLFFEFKAIAQSGCLVLEAYSVSHGKASAYLPVIDLLKSYFEIVAEDDERKRREKVTGKIVILDRTLEDTLPYLFALLGHCREATTRWRNWIRRLRRRRTLEAIKRILVRESLNQPLIVDLRGPPLDRQRNPGAAQPAGRRHRHRPHPAAGQLPPRVPPSMGQQDLLHAAAARSAGQRERGRDADRAACGDDPTRALAYRALKRLIIERTEGNPFFMEEMVQALFEQGVLVRNGAVKLAKPLDEIRVPPTVQAILASRIDRLPAGGEGVAADPRGAGQGVPVGPDQARGRQIRRRTGADAVGAATRRVHLRAAGDSRYRIHLQACADPGSRLQLGAGRAPPAAARARRLRRSKRCLPTGWRTISPSWPITTTAAAMCAKRSNTWGGRDRARRSKSAYSEAVGLPHQGARNAQATARRRGSRPAGTGPSDGAGLVVVCDRSGIGSSARRSWFVRGSCVEQLGDNAKLMEALLALALLPFRANEPGLARELAEGVLALAEQAKAPAMLAGAHSALGMALFADGQFEAAREHFERAIELFGPGPFRNFGEAYYAQLAAGHAGTVLLMPRLSVNGASQEAASRWPPRAGAPILFPFSPLCSRDVESIFSFETAAQRRSTPRRCFPSPPSTECVSIQQEVLFFRGWAMSATARGKEGYRRNAPGNIGLQARQAPPMARDAGHARGGLWQQWTSGRRP